MDFMAFLKPWLTDRAVWTMAVTWLVRLGCKKAGLNLDDTTVISLVAAVVTWILVHVVHVKTVEPAPKQ